MCNFLRVGSPLARDAVFIGWTPQVHGVAAEGIDKDDRELTDTSPAPGVNAEDDVDAVGAKAETKPVCNSKAKAKAKAASESEVEDKCDERVAAIATVDKATAADEPEVEDKGDKRVASLATVAADPEIEMRGEGKLDNSEKRSQELPAPKKAAKKKKKTKKNKNLARADVEQPHAPSVVKKKKAKKIVKKKKAKKKKSAGEEISQSAACRTDTPDNNASGARNEMGRTKWGACNCS